MNGVGLADLTSFGKFIVEGKDAEKALDFAVMGKLAKNKNKTCLAHALTSKGKVYAEWTVTKLDEDKYLVVTGAAVEGHDWRHLELMAKGKRAKVNNVSQDFALLTLAGPKSPLLFDDLVQDEQFKSFKWKFMDAKQVFQILETIFILSMSKNNNNK